MKVAISGQDSILKLTGHRFSHAIFHQVPILSNASSDCSALGTLYSKLVTNK